ncbi:hypothetical protein HMI54_014116 [Coelomomyces lativittatus]|nr:hypothetical protein HMI54_014116 [Coelomomyces lativittatus]KAJ1507078.1 hypothetical protein HMI55_000907 [Coelomomyces lativittatus]
MDPLFRMEKDISKVDAHPYLWKRQTEDEGVNLVAMNFISTPLASTSTLKPSTTTTSTASSTTKPSISTSTSTFITSINTSLPFPNGSIPSTSQPMNKCSGKELINNKQKYATFPKNCTEGQMYCIDPCVFYTCVHGAEIVPRNVAAGTYCINKDKSILIL